MVESYSKLVSGCVKKKPYPDGHGYDFAWTRTSQRCEAQSTEIVGFLKWIWDRKSRIGRVEAGVMIARIIKMITSVILE